MNKDELLELFDQFINGYGLANKFYEFAETRGYQESEIDDVMDNLNF